MFFSAALPTWAGVLITVALIAVAVTALVHFLFYIVFPFINSRFDTDIPCFTRKRKKAQSKSIARKDKANMPRTKAHESKDSKAAVKASVKKSGEAKPLEGLSKKAHEAGKSSAAKKAAPKTRTYAVKANEDEMMYAYSADVPTVRIDGFRKSKPEKLTLNKINEEAKKAGIEKGTGTDSIDKR